MIDDWLDEYRRDREAGLLELINFVVQCSGCKGDVRHKHKRHRCVFLKRIAFCCVSGVVTREMLSSMQNADIISHLTKEFNEVRGITFLFLTFYHYSHIIFPLKVIHMYRCYGSSFQREISTMRDFA